MILATLMMDNNDNDEEKMMMMIYLIFEILAPLNMSESSKYWWGDTDGN